MRNVIITELDFYLENDTLFSGFLKKYKYGELRGLLNRSINGN